jgi:hypothetical protein
LLKQQPQGTLLMLIAHLGKTPQVHPDAYIAPNAVICGDVTIRSDCRILFGAQVIAEGEVQSRSVENASLWRMRYFVPATAIRSPLATTA